MSILKDYLAFKKCLCEIEEIKKNPRKDKKYWTTHKRDYSTDFGIFPLAYYQGDYGSSSVYNVLPTQISDETKRLFSNYIEAKSGKLFEEFVDFLKEKVEKDAIKKLEELEKQKTDLLSIIKEPVG